MTQTDYTTRVLTPEPGHYLTQAADVAVLDRVVADGPLYLASTDTPSAWREITAEEAEVYLAARREAVEAQIPEEVKRRMAGREAAVENQSTPRDDGGE